MKVKKTMGAILNRGNKKASEFFKGFNCYKIKMFSTTKLALAFYIKSILSSLEESSSTNIQKYRLNKR